MPNCIGKRHKIPIFANMHKHYYLLLSGLLALCTSQTTPSGEMKSGIFNDCRQLVVVIPPNDSSMTAQLWRFEKTGATWQPIGQPHTVNLGKKGLAWGKGLHSAKPGLQKQEGDQKSPAGIFRFGMAFGYAPAGTVPLRLDYQSITPSQICVEDSDSRYYNQIVDERRVHKDWKNRESMLRKDEQYKWGIFVKHNLPPAPESGSCIFFHLWRMPGSGTLGCTAMGERDLLALMQWLDPQKKPLLMQMTGEYYREYQQKFGLPELW